jgi:two-component system, NarL family, nitrate/nitrite response regulator NarL
LRAGSGHMLSGSRFVLAANDVDDPSIISSIAGPEPALVLLCESLPIDARIATLEKLTMDCPSLRLVIVADDRDAPDVVRLCEVGPGDSAHPPCRSPRCSRPWNS